MKLNNALLRQTNAYAMQFGAAFGMFWCVGFAFMISGYKIPLLHLLWLLTLLVTPAVGIILAKKFQQEVKQDGMVDFGRAYLYSVMMYLYATVILAGVAYIYFRMIDNGAFVGHLLAQLHTDEMEELLKTPAFKQQVDEMLAQTGKESLDDFVGSITPIMIVANIVDMNLIFGLLLSIPTALMARTKVKPTEGAS
ncbi:MAG: DUF4199 domain-containing protein [Bacteroidaceae bacterium]|nr:DUF4199 domain-containing protein [Bacteroidaceae bacterium]